MSGKILWEKSQIFCIVRGYLGEGDGNPLQYSCLENLINRWAWWATVHGVVKTQDMNEHACMQDGIYSVNTKQFHIISFKLSLSYSTWGVVTLFTKRYGYLYTFSIFTKNIYFFSFCASVPTMHLCRANVVRDRLYMTGRGCVPIKLYLQNRQQTGFGFVCWPLL